MTSCAPFFFKAKQINRTIQVLNCYGVIPKLMAESLGVVENSFIEEGVGQGEGDGRRV